MLARASLCDYDTVFASLSPLLLLPYARCFAFSAYFGFDEAPLLITTLITHAASYYADFRLFRMKARRSRRGFSFAAAGWRCISPSISRQRERMSAALRERGGATALLCCAMTYERVVYTHAAMPC